MQGTGFNEIFLLTSFAYKRNWILRMYDLGVPFQLLDSLIFVEDGILH